MQGFKTAAAVIVGFILVVVLGIAAWQLGWFVEAKNVDRRTQVDNNSMGRQQALTSKVLRDISTVRTMDNQVPTPALKAQRIAIVEDICTNAGLLTGSVTMPASAESFINKECFL